MDITLEQRIEALEDTNFAQGLVLKWLMRTGLDKPARDALREQACTSVERLYERGLVIDHVRIQRVLVEVEALFDQASPNG